MTATHLPRDEADAAPLAFEDDDMPTENSATDAPAERANEPVPPRPHAPANPGFRYRSWR